MDIRSWQVSPSADLDKISRFGRISACRGPCLADSLEVKHQSGRPTDISSGPVTSTAMPVTLLFLSL